MSEIEVWSLVLLVSVVLGICVGSVMLAISAWTDAGEPGGKMLRRKECIICEQKRWRLSDGMCRACIAVAGVPELFTKPVKMWVAILRSVVGYGLGLGMLYAGYKAVQWMWIVQFGMS